MDNSIKIKPNEEMEEDFIPELGQLITDDKLGLFRVGDGIHKLSELSNLIDVYNNGKIHYGLGCMKPSFDPRDYQFSTLVTGAFWERLPKEFVPEFQITPFNQAGTSMCCACAVAMSRYIHELEDSANTKMFSPGYIYGNRASSVVIDGVYEGEGMFLKDAMKQLINCGDCFYDEMPEFGDYHTLKLRYEAKKEELDVSAKPFRVSSYYAVKSEREIKKAIMTSGSVLASFMITTGWYDAGEDGLIPSYGNIEGGHAVLLIGWKMINGKQYWIILNSWGKEWGDHGLGYIETTETMIEAYCILDEIHEAQFRVNKNKE